MIRLIKPGLGDVVDAVDPVHVSRGDRMDHGQPRGSPVARKRSPMAFNVASGHPSPDEELTETVAPLGMRAAASSSEIRFDRLIPMSTAISIAGYWNRAACLRRFTYRQGHRQRSDTVCPGSRRLPFATDGRVEAPHRSFVEVLVR